MILDNYWQYKAAVSDKYYSSGGNTNIVTAVKDLEGNTVNIKLIGNSYSLGYISNFSDRCNLEARVGTGDTDPVATNYALNNDVTSSFTLTLTQSLSYEDGTYKTVILIDAQNNSSSDITLKEVGICKAISWSYGDIPPYEYDPRCLFIHHILDEPVTVEAHGTKSLTFEWDQS